MAGGNAGKSVSSAGDVNGDGYGDVIIGAYQAKMLNRTLAGASYVIFGRSNATAYTDVDLGGFVSSATTGLRVVGAAANDYNGISVSGAGDFNNDGYADIITGSYGYDVTSPSRTNAGAAYILWGHSSATAYTDIDLLSLTSAQGFRITGAVATDFAGYSVSKAGDYNGDGVSDVVVGAQSADPFGKTSAGIVYVLFGHTTATSFPNIDLATFTFGSAGFRILGAAAGDVLGFSVGGGADLNGDGLDDLILGADFADPLSRMDAGIAYIIWGGKRSAFADIDLSTGLNRNIGYAILGVGAGDKLGQSVSLVRDFNGDGLGEIFVGSYAADPQGRTDAGAAYLVYDVDARPTSQPSRQPSGQPTSPPSRQPTGQPSALPTCQPSQQPTGQPSRQPSRQPTQQPTSKPSLRPSGQPSRQPTRQPTCRPTRQPSGQPSRQPSNQPTSVPSHHTVGARSGVNLALPSTYASNTYLTIGGSAANDQLAYSVSDAGDINKDGYSDVIVGAVLADPLGRTDAGIAYIVFGHSGKSTGTLNALTDVTGSVGFRVLGAVAGDALGYSVSGAGDFNKDGIDDFIVGTYNYDPPGKTNAGGAVVIFGKRTGWADIDMATFTSGSAGFKILGGDPGGEAGVSVSNAGDVNGDGYGDVIIGAYKANMLNRTQAGASYVIFGRSNATAYTDIDLGSFVSSATTGFVIAGAVADDRNGYSVSGAGDFNHDGFDDIITGAYGYDAVSPTRTFAGAAYILWGHSSATIDLLSLTSAQGFRVNGALTNDYVGWSVSKAGDVNGDGIADIVTGGYQANVQVPTSRVDAGIAYVLFGHTTATSFPNIDLANFVSGASGYRILGGVTVDYLSWSVSGGVDLNGDGLDDLLLGAQLADPLGRTNAGKAYAVLSKAVGTYSDIDLLGGLSPSVGYEIWGAVSNDYCGTSVSMVRDFDGDGYADVIVGAYQADPFGKTNAGSAYLVYGVDARPSSQPTQRPSLPTSQPSRQPSRQPSNQPTSVPSHHTVGARSGVDLALPSTYASNTYLTIGGAAANDLLAYSVSDAGDINKDGYSDIIAGAVLGDPLGRTNAGIAYIVFGHSGKSTNIVNALTDVTGSAGFKVLGAVAGDELGYSVSGAGDFNGDGIADFVVGMPFYDPPGKMDAGGAVVIFGKRTGWADIDMATFTSGSAGFKILGGDPGGEAGVSVSSAGDVNGDGFGDVILGAYQANMVNRSQAGASYVIFGRSNGTVYTDIDLTSFVSSAATGFAIAGAAARDYNGWSVSSAGDFNHDGYDDIITGAYGYDAPSRSFAGAAYILWGHSSVTIDLLSLTSAQGFRVNGALTNDYVGWSVSKAGDVNGDGIADVVFGGYQANVLVPSRVDAGIAYVLFGHTTATSFSNIDLASFVSGATGYRILGAITVDYLTWSVSGGVDLNGDGLDDLLLGAERADPSGRTDAGKAYAILSKASSTYTDVDLLGGLSPSLGFEIWCGVSSDFCGSAVSMVRDFDGDGYADVIVGACQADPFGRTSAGSAYLVYGVDARPSSQPSRQPMGQPTSQPSRQPSRQPTRQPTQQPTRQPSWQPTSLPSQQPSVQPTMQPTVQPSRQPSRQPSSTPQAAPSSQPTRQPSRQPSSHPTRQPSRQPTTQPSRQPTSVPTEFVVGARIDVDLAASPAVGMEYMTVAGEGNSDQFGYSVSTAGDINKDGYSDILVGALQAHPLGRTNAGAVYVVFGHKGKSTTNVGSTLDAKTNITGTLGFRVLGHAAGDQLGTSVSGAGDFNKDGIDDFIMGMHGYDRPGRTTLGGAVLIFGKRTGWVDIDVASLTAGNTGFKIQGGVIEGQAGQSVSSAGDVNGDGYGDVAIGAWKATMLNRTQAGASYVIFGRSNATAYTDIDLTNFVSSATIGFLVVGEAASDGLGVSVSSAGDFNHDGYADIIVGAAGYDAISPTRAGAGAAYILWGHSSATPYTDIDLLSLTSAQGFRINGAVTLDALGKAVSNAGDVNGDGIADVVIGAWAADPPPSKFTAGIVYVLFGHTTATAFANLDLAVFNFGSAGFRILGAAQGDRMGWSVSGGADLNGDGIDDVLMGGYLADPLGKVDGGTAYAVWGKKASTFADIDLSMGISQSRGYYAILGAGAGDNCGFSVSVVPDFDGNGIGDILVAAYLADPFNRTDSGAAYLVYGEDTRPSSQPSQQPSGQPTSQPSQQPSSAPTAQPLTAPSVQPTCLPSQQPSTQPSGQPSAKPSNGKPTKPPTPAPTAIPTILLSYVQRLESSLSYQIKNGYAFAVLTSEGSVRSWWTSGGTMKTEQSNVKLQTALSGNVTDIVPSLMRFTVVRSTSPYWVMWGEGKVLLSATNEIQGLVGNEAAFAGIDSVTGAIVAFGSKYHGGNVTDNKRCNGYSQQLTSTSFTSITASAAAFAALQSNGHVYAWGNPHTGGGTSTLTLPSLSNVEQVVATREAFAARKADGSVVAWGAAFAGGDSSHVTAQLSSHLIHVVGTRTGFVAINSIGGLVTWGTPSMGGDSSAVQAQLQRNVTFIAHTFCAIAALKMDATVVTWGRDDCGGDSDGVQAELQGIEKIYGNGKAFAAVNVVGAVVAWGKASDGGAIPADKAASLASGVVSIHTTNRAFVALKDDGSVVAWGQAGHGGDPGPAVQALLQSAVHTICANDVAFSAIKSDGSVVAWGHETSVLVPGVQLTDPQLASPVTCG